MAPHSHSHSRSRSRRTQQRSSNFGNHGSSCDTSKRAAGAAAGADEEAAEAAAALTPPPSKEYDVVAVGNRKQCVAAAASSAAAAAKVTASMISSNRALASCVFPASFPPRELMMPRQRALGARDAARFREMRTLFDQKQYRKAIKAADQILASFPEHAETCAMKSIALIFLLQAQLEPSKDKEKDANPNNTQAALDNLVARVIEARELAFSAVFNEPCSSLVWNILAIVHRDNLDPDLAAECYLASAMLDPTNTAILADLALMQVLALKLDDAKVTLHRLIQMLSPNPAQTTILLTRILTLAGVSGASMDYKLSLKMLDFYLNRIADFDYFDDEDANRQKPSQMTPEAISNAILAQVKVTILAKHHENALELLDINKFLIWDKFTAKELRAFTLMKLKRHEEAKEAYLDLIKRNMDNRMYIKHYCICQANLAHVSSNTREEKVECEPNKISKAELLRSRTASYALEELMKAYPDSITMPLMYLELHFDPQRQSYYEFAKSYLLRGFERGTPALFSLVKPILSHLKKCESMVTFNHVRATIVHNAATEITKELRHDYDNKIKSSRRNSETLIWALYFIACVQDYMGEFNKALESLDLADQVWVSSVGQDSGPDVGNANCIPVEFLMLRARVFKHKGSLGKAVDALKEACKNDPSDRCANTMLGKYLLLNQRIKESLDAMQPFASPKDENKVIQKLDESETMWFTQTHAQAIAMTSYLSQLNGNSGCSYEALKQGISRYRDIRSCLKRINADEIYFVNYCCSRALLLPFMDMIGARARRYSSFRVVQATASAILFLLHAHDVQSNLAKQQQFLSQNQAEFDFIAAFERMSLVSELSQDQPKSKSHKSSSSKQNTDLTSSSCSVETKDHKTVALPESHSSPLEEAEWCLKMLQQTKPVDFWLWNPEVQFSAFQISMRRNNLIDAITYVHQVDKMQGDFGFRKKSLRPVHVHAMVARLRVACDSTVQYNDPSSKEKYSSVLDCLAKFKCTPDLAESAASYLDLQAREALRSDRADIAVECYILRAWCAVKQNQATCTATAKAIREQLANEELLGAKLRGLVSLRVLQMLAFEHLSDLQHGAKRVLLDACLTPLSKLYQQQ